MIGNLIALHHLLRGRDGVVQNPRVLHGSIFLQATTYTSPHSYGQGREPSGEEHSSPDSGTLNTFDFPMGEKKKQLYITIGP